MNQIIQNVSQVKEGQTIGRTWTNNNQVYKTVGKVVKISGNTIKILSDLQVRGYEKGRVFTYSFSKSTKLNHVFSDPDVNEVIEFNNKEQKDKEIVDKVLNQYWEKGINKMEKERKEQGVYVESETFKIDGSELVSQYKTYGISE